MCETQRGLTLIEVVAALGLLAGVMIASMALFVQASSALRSAADATRALAVATSIQEETAGWGLRRLYLEFGRDGSSPSYRFDSSVEPRAAHWQDWVDRGLHDAFASLEIEALADTAGRVPDLSAARAVRVIVTVDWSETGRRQRVALVTVRI